MKHKADDQRIASSANRPHRLNRRQFMQLTVATPLAMRTPSIRSDRRFVGSESLHNEGEAGLPSEATAPTDAPIIDVASYFTPGDSYRHAIAGTSDGYLREIFFNAQQGVGRDQLACFDGVVGLVGFFTPDDNYQHIFVATTDGDLVEIYFDPQRGVFEDRLAQFNGIVDITGFYTADDQNRHVIVATSNGALTEVYFRPQVGIVQAPLGQFTNIVAIDGFYTDDDHYRHVIVVTNDGAVTEVFYHPSIGIHVAQPPLGQFNNVVDVAAFYTPDDLYRHVIVATNDGALTEIFYRSDTGVHISSPPLAHFDGLVGISAFYTDDDHYRHVIVATNNGTVTEVFYKPSTGVFIAAPPLAQYDSLLPTVEDVSPNTPTGTVVPYVTTTGLMLALTSTPAAVYTVSLNAGVWKTKSNGAWEQLAASPLRASCIAVDPNDATHLAVGERDGDAVDLRLNESGVWESHDSGATWGYTFNPLTLVGCSSQAIAAIIFSPTSTLFIATPCGIGRKPSNATTFDFSATPAGLGPVTALAVSQGRIWARTAERLLISADDGLTWTVKPIPPTVNGPPGGASSFTVTFASRGDLYSLAAFDAIAVMVFKPNPDVVSNKNTVLIYNSTSDSWTVQILDSGDGTGLGGRRMVKAFPSNEPGQPPELYFIGGQDVHKTVKFNSDNTFAWTLFAQTSASGTPGPIHPDLWDIHVAAGSVWLACDGGIYTFRNTWVTAEDGLHTHHIHTLTILPSGYSQRAKLAYATSDNDAWYRANSAILLPTANWQTKGLLGDANWTGGDSGSPALALLARQSTLAGLTAFGATPPIGANFSEDQPFALTNDPAAIGQLFLQFIQTPKGATPFPLLDGVMLAHLPLTYKDGQGNLQPVPGPLGQPNPGGHPVLLRTPQFAASPDVNLTQFQAWRIEASNVPLGARSFWVSGGHTTPVYYVYAAESNGPKLYKRTAAGDWQLLNVSKLLDGGWYGPVFVNPYDASKLFVLTADGVKVSVDGGASFQDEAVLTALITASGKFPLTGSFAGGNGSHVVIATRANPMASLSHMAFHRNNPQVMVAASPFTGVFYTNGDGQWRSLTGYLPRPYSPVSAVGIDSEAIYVATEGRSLVRIVGYRNAPVAALASYFKPVYISALANLLATLHDASQSPVANATVNARITDLLAKEVYHAALQTDGSGQLFFPSQLPPGTYLVHLRMVASQVTAATLSALAETSFVYIYQGAPNPYSVYLPLVKDQ